MNKENQSSQNYYVSSEDQFTKICQNKDDECINIVIESDCITIEDAEIPDFYLKSNLKKINLNFVNCSFKSGSFDLNPVETIGHISLKNCKFEELSFSDIKNVYMDNCVNKKIDKSWAVLDFQNCENIMIKDSTLKNQYKKLNWAIQNEHTENTIIKNTEINHFDKGVFISESNIKIIDCLFKDIFNTAVSVLKKDNKVNIINTRFKNCKNMYHGNSATDFNFENCPELVLQRI